MVSGFFDYVTGTINKDQLGLDNWAGLLINVRLTRLAATNCKPCIRIDAIVKGAFSGKLTARSGAIRQLQSKVEIEDAWEKFTHPSTMRHYNYNAATGYKQWKRAVEAERKPAKKSCDTTDTVPEGWELLLSDDGREFFYCVTSGEMSWKRPSSVGEKLTQPASTKHRFRCPKHLHKKI